MSVIKISLALFGMLQPNNEDCGIAQSVSRCFVTEIGFGRLGQPSPWVVRYRRHCYFSAGAWAADANSCMPPSHGYTRLNSFLFNDGH
jgi:hypothetical protein